MVGARRFLAIEGESSLGTAEVVIELQQSLVASMALELTLLLANLSTSLRLQPSAGPAIHLKHVAGDQISKATVAATANGAVIFALGTNQLGYLQAVLLRAYRDQVAEVNHVHIEGDREGAPFDLTIMFGVARSPMSAEEAELLLRD